MVSIIFTFPQAPLYVLLVTVRSDVHCRQEFPRNITAWLLWLKTYTETRDVYNSSSIEQRKESRKSEIFFYIF